MAAPGGGAGAVQRRGRGFEQREGARTGAAAGYDRLPERGGRKGVGANVAESANGWVLVVTGVHEEMQEDDLQDAFADYGEVRAMHMNLDRRTGYVKGYALLEFKDYSEAKEAKEAMDGARVLGKEISVDWAFVKHPARRRRGGAEAGQSSAE